MNDDKGPVAPNQDIPWRPQGFTNYMNLQANFFLSNAYIQSTLMDANKISKIIGHNKFKNTFNDAMTIIVT